MNKIAISLIALGVMASGAFASQRNNDETAARVFLYGIENASTAESGIAVGAGDASGSAFDALSKRAMTRQSGDDN